MNICSELLFYINAQNSSFVLIMQVENIKISKMEVLEDFELVCDYILQDFIVKLSVRI